MRAAYADGWIRAKEATALTNVLRSPLVYIGQYPSIPHRENDSSERTTTDGIRH
jgi:hypothetical protein